MARFGQAFINSLTNPSYGQGLFTAAQQFGAAPAVAQEKQQRSKAMDIVNQALASNNPEQLLQAAQAIKGFDPESAMKLSQAAGQIRQQTRQEQTASLEKAEQESIRKAQMSRAIQMAGQAKDTMGIQQLRAGTISPADYINQLAESSKKTTLAPSDRFKTVGNRIFDVVEEKYIEPSEAADSLSLSQLKEIATPESILEYVKTENKAVLKPISSEEEQEKPVSQIATKLAQADNVLTTVKEAAGLSEDVWRLSYPLAKLGPTAAKALSGKIDTLKANLSFDRLQQMRDDSKTGGALGQVSNIELNLLGSSVAALDPMSPDFAQQLKKIEDSYERFKAALLGKKPPGDKYIEDNGVLYYVNEDEEGNEQFISLGAM